MRWNVTVNLWNNALPYCTVTRWVGKFQQGRVSTSDKQCDAANADADGIQRFPHRCGDSSWELCTLRVFRPSVRALVPQKFSVEEELMHVKHVEVKSPHVGVMWKFGRGVISSGIVLVT
ncbi:hypothetical protein TNCV_5055641 [Trichonephila clavipes]|nr:hypothetical protein TNCV_5055641 [Trichonephila clavipes]